MNSRIAELTMKRFAVFGALSTLVLGLGCGEKEVVGVPVVVQPVFGTPYYYYTVLPTPPFTRIQFRQPVLVIR